jgi:hypothetical protein
MTDSGFQYLITDVHGETFSGRDDRHGGEQ